MQLLRWALFVVQGVLLRETFRSGDLVHDARMELGGRNLEVEMLMGEDGRHYDGQDADILDEK